MDKYKKQILRLDPTEAPSPLMDIVIREAETEQKPAPSWLTDTLTPSDGQMVEIFLSEDFRRLLNDE